MTKTPVHSVVNYSEKFFCHATSRNSYIEYQMQHCSSQGKEKKKRGGQQRAKDSGHPNSASPEPEVTKLAYSYKPFLHVSTSAAHLCQRQHH